MSNALSIFEKHLGGADILEGYLAKNIKDINQAIGSLQTIDSTLKKVCKNRAHKTKSIKAPVLIEIFVFS